MKKAIELMEAVSQSMEPKPILCKDCKFFRRDIPFLFSAEFAHCVFPYKKPEDYETFVVFGKAQKPNHFASICRSYSHLCGRDAKHFEVKP